MGFKIVIVEDEPKLREVLCDYFHSKGDIPFEADNGAKALELAQEQEFDAILLDIMMPELDGFSVCRALRKDNCVPIIFLVKCWGYDYEGESRAVDTHIRRLREKLGEHAACIKTVIKAGYVLEG